MGGDCGASLDGSVVGDSSDFGVFDEALLVLTGRLCSWDCRASPGIESAFADESEEVRLLSESEVVERTPSAEGAGPVSKYCF